MNTFQAMNAKKSLFLIGALALGAFLTGCKTPTAYYWGEYEEQIYQMYAAPEQATAEAQIVVLEAGIEDALSKDKPLAPGYRAHLGFLYYQLGQSEKARAAFEAEKAAFPESAQTMDHFLSKI